MTASASERQRAAVGLVGVEPHHRVLEAACGHGVAVSLVCERLTTGHVVALDRSRKMVDATQARNAGHVASGRVRTVCAELAEADLGDERFDVAFAFHLPVLLRGAPDAELEKLAGHLERPGGRLHVLFQPFTPEGVAPAVERVQELLDAAGWTVEDVRSDSLDPAPVVDVVAAPPAG